MATIRTAVRSLVKLGIAAAFFGLGVFGLYLMAGAIWYPTGWFWGVIVFLMGLLGVLLAIGAALTARNRPRTDVHGPVS